CFRPCVLPAEKNETENAHLADSQRNSEMFTNKPEGKNAGNAVCGHPVFRISTSFASGIDIAREGH
ncbi:hypothetical protein, partial [uncultured Bacteroides sp.]|uniref:hypothetical protein n=1 Tax=uncultured Bacteroides sp. TaxID=162156 RepID=UPI002602B896